MARLGYEPPIEPCRLVSDFWRPSGCLLTALCSTDCFYAQFHTHLAGLTSQLVLGQPLAYGGEGRNRALARRDFRRLRRRPLRPRLGQRRLIIKRDERERIQVPRPARPGAADAIRFEKSPQACVGERTGVKR